MRAAPVELLFIGSIGGISEGGNSFCCDTSCNNLGVRNRF